MKHDDIPEDREEAHQCPKCNIGSVIQCDITGDWTCNNCEFWAEASDDDDEDV